MTELPVRALASRIPDIPRWVEARDMLLSGDCQVFGLEESAELSLVVRDASTGLVVVVGSPAVTAIRDAAEADVVHGACVVAAREAAQWVEEALPRWSRSRAIVHLLPSNDRLPAVGDVGFLDSSTIASLDITPELRRDLVFGAGQSSIAAAFVDGVPVAFCFAGAVTETLWDISIDTVAAHRRRGHASRCVSFMIQHMRAQGRQPVWAADVENPASWQLARKLGFVVVDEVALFEPGSP